MTKKARRRAQHALPVRANTRADGTRALEVGNVTQSVTLPTDESVAPGGYWARMLPERCPRCALLLGLGGGTVARLLARACPGVAMVGVEHDAMVLALARSEFGLDAIPGLEVLEADAFAWVEDHALDAPERYDLICLDLFDGGRLAPGTLARPFLRQIAAMLAPEGTLTINLMRTGRLPEQLHRIESVFALERQVDLWGNVVLHLRGRSAPTAPTAAPARSCPAIH